MLAEKDGDDGLYGGDDAGCSALGQARFFRCGQFASRVFAIPGEAREQQRDRLHQAYVSLVSCLSSSDPRLSPPLISAQISSSTDSCGRK